MKISNKNSIIFILLFFLTVSLIGSTNNSICTSTQIVPKGPIKVVVLLSSFKDGYISLVKQNLEKIQKDNSNQIEFIFFDGKGNQDIQNESMPSIFETDFQVLLANLVDFSEDNIKAFINKVKIKNIPVIIFNVAPFESETIKSYPKALVVATDSAQSGVLEGKIIVNSWNANKQTMDKNKDNILQYIMITSKPNNTLITARDKYSISTINDSGIKTQEIAKVISISDTKESVKADFEQVFLRSSGSIEAVIASDDTLAIGAIEVMEKYGYNLGNISRTIPTVGVNAILEARELVNRGIMTGTVVQDAPAMAEALYKVSMNLALNKKPLENTNYKFNETGVVIEMPYYEYKKEY